MAEERFILVCQGTGCVSAKSPEIQASLVTELENAGLTDIQVKLTGCHGFCQQGPIVIVEPEGIFYSQVSTEDLSETGTWETEGNEMTIIPEGEEDNDDTVPYCVDGDIIKVEIDNSDGPTILMVFQKQ